jgi:hypothetical protein
MPHVTLGNLDCSRRKSAMQFWCSGAYFYPQNGHPALRSGNTVALRGFARSVTRKRKWTIRIALVSRSRGGFCLGSSAADRTELVHTILGVALNAPMVAIRSVG